MSDRPLTWIEINEAHLRHNVMEHRRLIGPDVLLTAVVKSNAYGHDIVLASKIFLDAGADWLAVHSLNEAVALRNAGITAPIYILGYVQLDDLEQAINLDCRIVVYNNETIERLGQINQPVRVHIKIETGTHRQGVLLSDLDAFTKKILEHDNITIEGAATHFANVEDMTNDDYYQQQHTEFKKGVEIIESNGVTIPIKHCAAAAAAMLFPESHYDMVRFGVSMYGLWPSNKTKVAYDSLKQEHPMTLKTALTWKSRIAQIKTISRGEFIGYGCTHQTTRETVMAVLPVGYYDGYVRALSGRSHVLVHGQRAPLLGRVSMNNIVVDITDIPGVTLENEAVLLGVQRDEEITPEQFATWAETINYEIPTRINAGVNSNIPRVLI